MIGVVVLGAAAMGLLGCDTIFNRSTLVMPWSPLAVKYPDYARRANSLDSAASTINWWSRPPAGVDLDAQQFAEFKKKLADADRDYAQTYKDAADLFEKKSSGEQEAGKRDEALAALKKKYDDTTATHDQAWEYISIHNSNRPPFPTQPSPSETFPPG